MTAPWCYRSHKLLNWLWWVVADAAMPFWALCRGLALLLPAAVPSRHHTWRYTRRSSAEQTLYRFPDSDIWPEIWIAGPHRLSSSFLPIPPPFLPFLSPFSLFFSFPVSFHCWNKTPKFQLWCLGRAVSSLSGIVEIKFCRIRTY